MSGYTPYDVRRGLELTAEAHGDDTDRRMAAQVTELFARRALSRIERLERDISRAISMVSRARGEHDSEALREAQVVLRAAEKGGEIWLPEDDAA